MPYNEQRRGWFIIFALSNCIVWNLTAIHFAFEKLTILTKPVQSQRPQWEHFAVVRSLKEGLSRINVPYNYNPSSFENIGDIVIVPCNQDALRQAVDLKKSGRIKKILVGPNFWPEEINYPEVDVYIVPSQPIIKYISVTGPYMASRCRVMFAGVNPDFWMQQNDNYLTSKNVLVYWKNESEAFCQEVEKILQCHGWNPIRIKYGNYSVMQYRDILQNCRFAVFISRSESQGLALAESWAMNIPTFPWNPMSTVIRGQTFDFVPSCPYLTEKTGVAWKTFEELEHILQSVDELLKKLSPRSWIVESMTDEISAMMLVGLINNLLDTY